MKLLVSIVLVLVVAITILANQPSTVDTVGNTVANTHVNGQVTPLSVDNDGPFGALVGYVSCVAHTNSFGGCK